MQLDKLVINGVRNLSDIHLGCSHHVNIITGRNAAGKTAVLESIYILARAASFRTPRVRDVIQHGKQGFSVSARLMKNNEALQAGIEKTYTQTQIRFNGERVSKRSEQAVHIPVLAYSAETGRLLYGPPRVRRRWLDWSLFHVEPDYLAIWRKYHYALRQRNSLLREDIGEDAQYHPWEQALAETGHWLNAARNKYLAGLDRVTNSLIDGALGNCVIEFSCQQGDVEDNRKLFERERRRDRMAGYTQLGPHKHDICFQVNGYPAGKTLSRGEGKQFLLCLIIAQAREYLRCNLHFPVVLVDDLPAELDRDTCAGLFQLLARETGQLFITTTNETALPVAGVYCHKFHVEHGSLTELVE